MTTMFSDKLQKALEIKKFDRPVLNRSLDEIHYYQDLTKKIGRFAVPIKWTPEMAKHYLDTEKNPNNRPLHEKKVAKYAKDIINDLFIENGETIVLADDDTLMDGQNRLAAAVSAKKAIWSLTAFGYPRSVMRSFDQGDSRTLADIMTTTGWPHGETRRCAAALALYINYIDSPDRRYARGKGSGVVSNQYMMDKCELYEDVLGEGVNAIKYRWVRRYLLSSAVTAWMVLSKKDKKACNEFFSALDTGANLMPGSAILQFRDHMIKVKMRSENMTVRSSTKLKRELGKEDSPLIETVLYSQASMIPIYGEQKLELILRYWNLWRQGKKVRQSEKLHGEYPIVL